MSNTVISPLDSVHSIKLNFRGHTWRSKDVMGWTVSSKTSICFQLCYCIVIGFNCDCRIGCYIAVHYYNRIAMHCDSVCYNYVEERHLKINKPSTDCVGDDVFILTHFTSNSCNYSLLLLYALIKYRLVQIAYFVPWSLYFGQFVYR